MIEKTVRYVVEFRDMAGTHAKWENYSEHATWDTAAAEVRECRHDNAMEEGDRSFRLTEVTEIRQTVSSNLETSE